MQTISFFGLGYVGLPSAAVFADSGLNVVGVDIDEKAVATINEGSAHIIEPGLDDLLSKVVGNGSLRAVTVAEKADVFVIAVPTPFKEGRVPDLRFVEAATKMIAPLLEKGNLVILESTSPVGATEMVAELIASDRPDLKIPKLGDIIGDVNIAYCPERILPGKVIQEVVTNERVIGGITPSCSEHAVAFYKHAVKGVCHVTNSRTAELCKLSENSFRDVNIAFANELSMVCDKLDVDVWELVELANRHPRVNILQPGTGVGGHCIAVDPWFIVDSAPKETRLIRTAREVNDHKPQWVLEKILGAITKWSNDRRERNNVSPKIACYGLAFKPDIDDLRHSPALEVVQQLAKFHRGGLIIVEPNLEYLDTTLSKFDLETPDVASKQADIHILLVDHKEFFAMPKPNGEVLDFRGVWK